MGARARRDVGYINGKPGVSETGRLVSGSRGNLTGAKKQVVAFDGTLVTAWLASWPEIWHMVVVVVMVGGGGGIPRKILSEHFFFFRQKKRKEKKATIPPNFGVDPLHTAHD